MSHHSLDPDSLASHFERCFPNLPGSRLVIALSGGADSVAMLHLLDRSPLVLELQAVHVHHGLRGDEADADAAFCTELCGSMDVPVSVIRLEPPRRAPEGREATWRRLRYAALERARAELGAAATATAHHRDDVAEGVLMQILRGSGPRGLCGIAASGPGRVVRPLLPWTRDQILGWLNHEGLEWREDSSNRDPTHLRNRVRLQLLPGLEAASPRLREHLVFLAESLACDQRHFESELAKLAVWIDPWHPDGGVEIERVAGMSEALRTRWLQDQGARLGLDRVTRRQAHLFGRLIDTGMPRSVGMARRWSLRAARGRLWLEPPELPPGGYRIPIDSDDPEGRHPLPLPGWWVEVHRWNPQAAPPTLWRRVFAAGTRLELRTAEPGEKAGHGDSDVRSLLRRRLPRHLRAAWPVLSIDGRIEWIPGVWQASSTTDSPGVVVEVKRG